MFMLVCFFSYSRLFCLHRRLKINKKNAHFFTKLSAHPVLKCVCKGEDGQRLQVRGRLLRAQVRTLSESRLKARWCGRHQAKSRANQGCAAQLELPAAASHTLGLAKDGLMGVPYSRRSLRKNIWTHRVCVCVLRPGGGAGPGVFKTH